MQRQLDPAKLMEDFFAAFEFLRDHEHSTGRVGCVGFCYGGGVCNALAVDYPDLAASVPFYGRQPAVEDVPSIQAPESIRGTNPCATTCWSGLSNCRGCQPASDSAWTCETDVLVLGSMMRETWLSHAKSAAGQPVGVSSRRERKPCTRR